ncbi:MAG: PhzF family phenazine biosynthesis protein, partial [Gammaproteobacteria bacterium]|nr:PhzF family phenazine biosynthesis protein [Gammaproteobacteria bacterium]
MTHKLYMVDVFAQRPYAGNPLAVVVGEQFLPDETMQAIAAEMNFSETTFVLSKPEDDGAYHVRIFTPSREIEFTGHPILGTAWVIRNYLAMTPMDEISLKIAVGKVMVTFESDKDGKELAWFTAPSMTLGSKVSPEPMARALGLNVGDIDTAAPIQVISAGTSAIIVPLCSLDALQRSRLDPDEFEGLAAQGFPPLVYIFCRQTDDINNDLRARFFFEAHGVREDPATGNGAAFLGTYLLEHKVFAETELSIQIEQGQE